jgi:hypothetical protein
MNNPHNVTKTQLGLGNVTNVDTTMASNVGIVDAGNIITATTVEDALQEDVTNLNAHKADNVRHITAAERTSWNNKADGTALSIHMDDDATQLYRLKIQTIYGMVK